VPKKLQDFLDKLPEQICNGMARLRRPRFSFFMKISNHCLRSRVVPHVFDMLTLREGAGRPATDYRPVRVAVSKLLVFGLAVFAEIGPVAQLVRAHA
jgi:hypothetical protein